MSIQKPAGAQSVFRPLPDPNAPAAPLADLVTTMSELGQPVVSLVYIQHAAEGPERKTLGDPWNFDVIPGRPFNASPARAHALMAAYPQIRDHGAIMLEAHAEVAKRRAAHAAAEQEPELSEQQAEQIVENGGEN